MADGCMMSLKRERATGYAHWLPLVLSVVLLTLSLLRRSRVSLPGVQAYMESCSWLMFMTWALQANGLVYELVETPHALLYVEVLPAVFRDILGSYGVGAVLILVKLLAVWIVGEASRESEKAGAFDLSKKFQKSMLFLVLFQVVINSWLTMIIALEFAVSISTEDPLIRTQHSVHGHPSSHPSNLVPGD